MASWALVAFFGVCGLVIVYALVLGSLYWRGAILNYKAIPHIYSGEKALPDDLTRRANKWIWRADRMVPKRFRLASERKP